MHAGSVINDVVDTVYTLRSQVDQPLCGDCCAKIQKDVEVAVRDAEREIEAYQAALRRLSAAEETAMPDEEFRRQLAAAEEEEERERCRPAEHGCFRVHQLLCF